MPNGIGAATMVAGAPPESIFPVRAPPTSAIVIALGVAQIFGWGSSYYLLGTLTKPIAAETAWSGTWILAGLSLSLLIAGTISPRMGQAVAERGGRHLLAASTLLLAVGLVILANSHARIVYLVGWIVMGLGMGLGLYDAAFATLGRHFGDGSRGPITALTLIAGFSSTVTWPLSLFFLGQVGWRGTCIAYAVIEVALCLPLYLLFAPSTARTARTEPVGAALSNRSPPRDRTYYILSVILTLIAAVNAVVSVNLILILTSFGLAYATAVGLATLLGPSQVLARLGEMFLGRQYHPTVTLTLATGSIATGNILFVIGAAAMLPAVVLYGGGAGLAWVARGTVPMAIFGPGTYAVQLGRLARPALIAQALAPAIGGFLLQWIGTLPTLSILAVASSSSFVLAIVLAILSRTRSARVR